MAKVLRTFRDAPSGRVVNPGDEIHPTPGRHEELAEQGLVEPPGAGAKAAEPPANKTAEPPVNKAVTAPAEPEKRGPGRPPVKR